jgi:hypothetical protein
MQMDADRSRPLPVLFAPVARKRNDRGFPQLRHFPELSSDLVPIHPGEADV